MNIHAWQCRLEQIALEGQDLPCTYLARHDLESAIIVIVVIDAGWSGNQVVGGLLLQSTRHTVVKSCEQRFSKFLTTCTEQQTVYDAETGKAVVQPLVVEGLAPYGVDAVFLATSVQYNEDLAVGKCI